MSAHTKTPWAVSEYKDGRRSIIIDGDGFGIAQVDYSNRDANTRRIVACVNACEGIDTESLEADGYGENWAEIARHRLELMELVTVMEEKHGMFMTQAQAELRLLRGNVKAVCGAVEAMRTAGGSREFQAAFDAAKVLTAALAADKENGND